jgi:serine/threonine protein kinase
MYDLNREKGTYYITMEFVDGEDLKSFIRRSGLLSVGKSLSIANQVSEGLSEAHRLGVVHRDLKPQNIMIDSEGNARIMDFGIARSLKTKGITGSGIMIGTPEYM